MTGDGELETVQIAVEREFGGAHLVADGTRLPLNILGLQQAGEDIEWRPRPFDSLVDDFVEGGDHPVQALGLEPGHHLNPITDHLRRRQQRQRSRPPPALAS